MTPDQISLVQTSFATVSSRLDDLATRVYAELFSRDPDLRRLFPSDLAAQRANLTAELGAVVAALGNASDLAGQTLDLGARHVTYGVSPEDYETFGESLRTALAGVLGDSYDDDLDEAWRLAYNLVAAMMVHGANQPPGGPARRSLRTRVV